MCSPTNLSRSIDVHVTVISSASDDDDYDWLIGQLMIIAGGDLSLGFIICGFSAIIISTMSLYIIGHLLVRRSFTPEFSI